MVIACEPSFFHTHIHFYICMISICLYSLNVNLVWGGHCIAHGKHYHYYSYRKMSVYDVESEIGTFDCSHNGFYRLSEFWSSWYFLKWFSLAHFHHVAAKTFICHVINCTRSFLSIINANTATTHAYLHVSCIHNNFLLDSFGS